jgi:hypothetical protein
MGKTANKALVQTAPALANFGIRARHNRFGGSVGAFLPHRARARLHNAGVQRRAALPTARGGGVAQLAPRYKGG